MIAHESRHVSAVLRPCGLNGLVRRKSLRLRLAADAQLAGCYRSYGRDFAGQYAPSDHLETTGPGHMTDSFSGTLVAATITAIANGAAGEAGKQAWTSLTGLIRKALGRNPPLKTELQAIQKVPHDEYGIAEFVATLAALARDDQEFSANLAFWLTRTQHDLNLDFSKDKNVNTITGNDLSAQAGNVVQARSIYGGLHFHESSDDSSRNAIPRQLPGVSHNFVDPVHELKILTASWLSQRYREVNDRSDWFFAQCERFTIVVHARYTRESCTTIIRSRSHGRLRPPYWLR